jgi:AraC-like DNA-binding protein
MPIQSIVGIRVVHTVSRDRNLGYFKSDAGDIRSLNIILMILKGRTVFTIDRKRILAGRNDIICFDTGRVSEKYPSSSHSISYRLVSFEIISQDRKPLILSDLGFPVKINVQKPGRIRSLLTALHETFQSGNPFRLPLCSKMGLELLMTLHTRRKDAGRYEQLTLQPLHFRIREALEYINAHYKMRMSVATLAQKACMHPAYFSHLFKKEVGLPPHQYVLEVKIAKAKDFLVTHDKALAYTGEELGFHDHSHFYRTFRRITGQSPRAFVNANKILYDPR